MPKSRRIPVTRTDPSDIGSEAPARIDATCRGIVAGKLATRELSLWVTPVGLSEAEFRILWLLRKSGNSEVRGGAADQTMLAEELVVSPAQVSGLVERLRSRGLIEPEIFGGDRRRQAWRLTKDGELAVATVLSVVAALGIPPLAPPFQGGGFAAEDAA
jgi:DNA-binding MarR family transcriptional regulator